MLEILPIWMSLPLVITLLCFVPGALLLRRYPGVEFRDAASWPAVSMVFSFLLLAPALVVFMLLRVPVWVIPAWALAVSLALLVSRGGRAQRLTWPSDRIGMAVTSAAVFASVGYRVWATHGSADDVTHAVFIGAVRETGFWPSTVPFLDIDVPLSIRWGVDGWTALHGAVSHLAGVSGLDLMRVVLPPLLLIVGASAAYTLGRYLGGTERFGFLCASAALAVPFLDNPLGNPSEFLTWYRALQQSKYAAVVIFLPVVAVMLFSRLERARLRDGVVCAVLLVAILFVHPLLPIFVIAVVGCYALVEVLKGIREWRRLLWIAGVGVPVLASGLLLSIALPGFGVGLDAVDDVSEVASARRLGPVTVWEGRALPLLEVEPDDAPAFFLSQRLSLGTAPRVLLLNKSWYTAHYNVLLMPLLLMPLVAAAIALWARSRVAVWVLASHLAVLPVFFLPPVAVVVGTVTTPFQLWRFVWLLPVAVSAAWLFEYWSRSRLFLKVTGLVFVVLLGIATPKDGFDNTLVMEGSELPFPSGILAALEGTILTDEPWGDLIPAFNANLSPVAYRGATTMSNAFPRERLPEALDRLQSKVLFFTRTSTHEMRMGILERHDISFVVVSADQESWVRPTELGLGSLGPISEGLRLFERTG